VYGLYTSMVYLLTLPGGWVADNLWGQRKAVFVGGVIIAISEVTVTYAYRGVLVYFLPEGWMPEGLVQLLSTEYKFAVSFIILVVVLLVRPTGIFRGKVI
jgi:branched-chain amino acid transport system permease protein